MWAATWAILPSIVSTSDMRPAARDIPNILTILRFLLTIPVAYLLLEQRYTEALVLFFIAGVSDGLDGYLAKRFDWSSRLGSILDPLADKTLLVVTYVCLGLVDIIPMWLVFLVLGRDLVIVVGGLAYYLLIGSYQMEPSWVSKANTTLQIVLALVLVFSLGVYELPSLLLVALVYSVCVTTVLSGLDYIWTWGRRAHHHIYHQRHTE